MRPLKTLLVWPPDPPTYFAPNHWAGEPLALEYLAGTARLDGHEARLLDMRFDDRRLEEVLEALRPDVVATTAYTLHVKSARRVLQRARASLPDCLTVVGGHHASLMPEDFFHPYVDYVVAGEGVRQFQALLQHRATEGRQGTDVLAGVWRREQGRFIRTEETPEHAVDALPRPDRQLSAPYRQHYQLIGPERTALLLTAVGCAYRCSFCALWRLLKGKHLPRRIEDVVDEMRAIEERRIFLTDDEPFADTERMYALARAVGDAGLDKEIFAYCRADDLVDRGGLVEAWRDVGLRGVSMGIEGVTQRELEGYNKRLSLAQVEAAFRRAGELGIEVASFFIVDPRWELADFERLHRFIERHEVKYPLFSVLTPLPGTPALRTFDAICELDGDGRPDWDRFDFQQPVTPTRLPREQFMALYLRLWREVADRNPGGPGGSSHDRPQYHHSHRAFSRANYAKRHSPT